MRKGFFWLGWVILIGAPIVFVIEIVVKQDLPPVEIWHWAMMACAVGLVFFTRNRDEVLKHHLV
jgi:hypothetical protein